jgi:ribosome-binding protein aMBF1 (putative translation factor)
VKQKPIYFDEWLQKKLKNPEFRKHFRHARLAVEVAHQIVPLREKLGLSQEELARRMGTKQQTISRLERGDYAWMMRPSSHQKGQRHASLRPHPIRSRP